MVLRPVRPNAPPTAGPTSGPTPGPQRPPVFLNRPSYRRRRMRDASRLLPVLGVVLILLPMGWPVSGPGGGVVLGAYLFAVWAGLVLAAWVLSPHLRDWADGDDEG